AGGLGVLGALVVRALGVLVGVLVLVGDGVGAAAAGLIFAVVAAVFHSLVCSFRDHDRFLQGRLSPLVLVWPPKGRLYTEVSPMPIEYFEARERALLGPRFAELYATPEAEAAREIGRASCRERVEMGGR